LETDDLDVFFCLPGAGTRVSLERCGPNAGLTVTQGVWKRRIATYKQLGDTQKAIEDLCAYLDTFYTDVEGWLEVADLYAGCQR